MLHSISLRLDSTHFTDLMKSQFPSVTASYSCVKRQTHFEQCQSRSCFTKSIDKYESRPDLVLENEKHSALLVHTATPACSWSLSLRLPMDRNCMLACVSVHDQSQPCEIKTWKYRYLTALQGIAKARVDLPRTLSNDLDAENLWRL